MNEYIVAGGAGFAKYREFSPGGKLAVRPIVCSASWYSARQIWVKLQIRQHTKLSDYPKLALSTQADAAVSMTL